MKNRCKDNVEITIQQEFFEIILKNKKKAI